MPGSPFYSGLFEGFQGRRQSEYERNLEAEGKAREAESNVYKYLLQSTDPKIQSLAMAGLFESARPGTRAKGLRGFMGEVQGGEIYPQILSAMEEQVPDAAAAPAARPQSAALPSTTPVHGGPIGTTPPQGPPAAAAMPQAPEDITAALGMGAPESGFGAQPPMGPAAGAAGIMGQPPPEHPTHRRGTGVPTAEEVAEMQARVATQTRIKVATEELTRAGATPEEIQHTIMGMLGAPQNQRQFAAPTFAVEDPETHVPTPVSFDYTTGKYAYPDGTPVPKGAKFVRMAGAGGGGSLTSTAKDTPEMRQWLLQNGADPKDLANGSPTGYWRYQQRLDGSMMVGPGEYTPAAAFIGTTTGLDANGNPVVMTVPRGGPPGPGNIIAPAVSGQQTQEQTDASALLAEINEAVKAAEAPVYPGQPPQRLTPLQRDTIARERASAAKLPYTTYYEVQQAARQQRRPSPSPTTPKPAAVPGGGGSAMSLADQVRADLLAQQAGRAGAAPPPPPAAAPPARARGAGPVGR